MTFPLTLLFMFLVFWRPQEWLIPWMFGWPLLSVVMYVALLSLIMEVSQGNARLQKSPTIMLAAGLFIATLLSHVAHLYFQGIINTVSPSFKFCFFTVLLLFVINSVERLRAVMLVFILAAVIMSIHVIMEVKTGYGFAGAQPMWDYSVKNDLWIRRGCFFGIFADPNDTAQFLATSFPLVFAYPRRLTPINFLMACGVGWLILMGMNGCYSRGGMIALGSVVMCIVFLKLPRRWVPYAGVTALVAGLVLCYAKGGVLMDFSARERVVFWGYANYAFKHNLLFGLGYGMFWQVAGDRAAHNAFVSCYTELGLVGYWFWFSLMMLGVVGCWRVRGVFNRPRTGVQSYLKRAAGLSIASMVGFAAAGYFLSRAFVFPLFFLFGMLNVIPLIAKRYLPEDHPPLLNVSTDVFGTGTLTTLGSVVYIYLSILALNKSYGG